MLLMPLTVESLRKLSVLLCLVEVKTLARMILVDLWLLAAIGCAEPNYPGVYSNVATLKSFVTENTGVQ